MSRRIQHSSSSPTEHDSSREEIPQQTLVRSQPNTPNELVLGANNNVWKVGSMHADGRDLRIEVISGLFVPSGKCSRKITDIMYERLEPTGFNWKAVSDETKQFYFEEFKKWFVWRQEDKIVYGTWLKSASRRYSELCCGARSQWEKKAKPSNKIGNDVWLSWVENWNTPEFQETSVIQKKNRSSGFETNPSTHTGGSASHRVHVARLKEKLDRDPTSFELYEHTHTKKNDKKTWINQKSQQTYEKYETLLMQHAQPTEGSSESQPIDQNNLFYEAVGGHNKKNLVYGLGSSQNIFYGPGSSNVASHYTTTQSNSQDYEKLQAELQEMKEANEMQKKEVDDMKDQMREMQSQLAMVLDSQN